MFTWYKYLIVNLGFSHLGFLIFAYLYLFPIGAKDTSSLLSDVSKKDLWKFKNHKLANDFPEEIDIFFAERDCQ